MVDALVSGWQLSGLARWTSGLPFTVMAGNGWEVDWSQESAVVKTAPVKMHKHLNSRRVSRGVRQSFRGAGRIAVGTAYSQSAAG